MSHDGSANPNWKGGRGKGGQDGRYVIAYAPEHPRAVQGHVLEHRLVMERHLGRYLQPGEIVHHRNEDPTDNRIENLEVMTQAEHALHHIENLARHRYVRPPATRYPRVCDQCGGEFEAIGKKQLGRRFCSRPCYMTYRLGRGSLQKGAPA